MTAAAGLAYVACHRLAGRPNVIVDGSPAKGTTLTLTHWPGYQAPAGLARGLSAQMAFAYLDAGAGLHAPAAAVSSNHFDQDGLAGLFALTRPEAAQARRALLIDLAAAGDFATCTSRAAARISMVCAAYAGRKRSPLAWPATTASGVSSFTPSCPAGGAESRIAPDQLLELILADLARSPADWDPYQAS